MDKDIQERARELATDIADLVKSTSCGLYNQNGDIPTLFDLLDDHILDGIIDNFYHDIEPRIAKAIHQAHREGMEKERNKFVSHYETFVPIDELHVDDGVVLLWNVPICAPPDCMSCGDDNFVEGNYTHYTYIVRNSVMEEINEAHEEAIRAKMEGGSDG